MKLQTDFPTAWAVMRKTDPQQHHERCSYRQTNGGVLCDCAAQAAFIATVGMQNEQSFSEKITTDGKKCPTCGSLWVIAQRHLPAYLMPALQILMNRGGTMTAKELTEATGNRQVYTKFAWLAHWGLIGKSDVKSYAYYITEKGAAFLFGEVQVPEFLWMLKNKVVPTPEGEREPRMVYIHELAKSDTPDHQEHVDRSAPVHANS